MWAYDFVFDTCANGQTLKCLTIIDEWTRECLAIDVAGGIRSGLVIEVLLPSARPGSFENTLTYDTETDFSIYKRKIPSITRHIPYHVFESADRLARLSEILAERFPYRATSSNG